MGKCNKEEKKISALTRRREHNVAIRKFGRARRFFDFDN
jgi:hypothetical protein